MCQDPSAERKRCQPSPTPGRTSVCDVTRIDIYLDSNGDPATRCTEPRSSAVLSAKPPRSSFSRSVKHASRNSSAHRKQARSTSSSGAAHLSRSADASRSRSKTGNSVKSDNKLEDSDGAFDNDNDGDDDGNEVDAASGVYCVIKSGVTPRSRVGRQFPGTLTKHQFRQVCSRPHQAVVFTADTASLLLQSGPPMLIRPAADVSLHRSTTRSAIQRVTDVNYLTELHAVPRSKSGIESGSRRNQDLYRARLALGRSGTLKSADVTQTHPDTSPSQAGGEPVKALPRTTSEETLCRSRSADVKKKRLDTQQAAYISRDSSAGSRHHQRTSAPAQSRSEPSNSATASNMARRHQVKKATQQKPQPAPLAENVAGNHKTLSPSKHGFHPRSHSPTFKRLFAASERLQEAQPALCDPSMNTASVSSYPVDSNFYDSSSSESLRDMRTTVSQDLLNGILQADRDSNNNDIDIHSKKTANNTSSSPRCLRERNVRVLHKHQSVPNQESSPLVADTGVRRDRGGMREARALRRKTQSHVMRQRHDVSYDRAVVHDTASSAASGPINPYSRETQGGHKRTSRLPGPGGGELSPSTTPPLTGHHAVEMEARVRDGQPTQLHFFLPQLADGMSDGSAGNLTGRSNYRERRLELLDWRDSRCSGSDGGLHHDSSAVGPGGVLRRDNNDENDPTSTTTITKIQISKVSKETRSRNAHPSRPDQQPVRDPTSHKTNGHRGASKERITACDLKNGHLTLNRGRQSPQARDDGFGLSLSQKPKRQISPLRAQTQKVAERPARNRRASNSPFRAPVYLESQLPSEKLKKQIEDFPTLVSMDYSETDIASTLGFQTFQ